MTITSGQRPIGVITSELSPTPPNAALYTCHGICMSITPVTLPLSIPSKFHIDMTVWPTPPSIVQTAHLLLMSDVPHTSIWAVSHTGPTFPMVSTTTSVPPQRPCACAPASANLQRGPSPPQLLPPPLPPPPPCTQLERGTGPTHPWNRL
ncbi:hypothetical protein Pelo_1049 [Pelomyxa schiedti]|nr:hypothetical protein Pelo_1049 [Pelomyxa schiedti]